MLNRQIGHQLLFSIGSKSFSSSSSPSTIAPLVPSMSILPSCHSFSSRFVPSLINAHSAHSNSFHSHQNVPSPPPPSSSVPSPRLLIFDKDGTLICFNSQWIPWVRNFVAHVDQESRLGIAQKVFRALGFCPIQKKVRRGLLAEGTMDQIREEVARILVQHGMEQRRANTIVQKAVHETSNGRQHSKAASSNFSSSSVRQLANLKALFRLFKGRGIKIAICTADNRASTMSTLKALGVERMVDLVVCGDDNGSKPKPDPDNALFICRQLGVHPAQAMVIGDTPADLGMGKRAQLGATVGVLSGVGEPRELQEEADHLVEDVGELVRLIET